VLRWGLRVTYYSRNTTRTVELGNPRSKKPPKKLPLEVETEIVLAAKVEARNFHDYANSESWAE